LTALPARRVQSLFSDSGGDAEPLFSDDGDGDLAMGVESLAPPLPPPPQPLSPEASEKLGKAVGELRRTSQALGGQVAATALEIACLLAKRIIEEELKSDPKLRLALARSAVRRVGEAQKVTIRLSPADVEAVTAVAGEGDPLGLPMARIEVVTDTNLSPGDSIVESDTAMVDGRIGTRLEELRRVFRSVIDSDNGEG
jgi:flagellar biosynthesis/type III secretory pathway protein FliH